MPTVTFLGDDFPEEGRTVECADGENILDAALDNDIPLEHNCGGVCACSTCHVVVQDGYDGLPEITEDEEDQLDEADGLTLTSRLGCQCVLTGNQHVTVVVPHVLVREGRINQS